MFMYEPSVDDYTVIGFVSVLTQFSVLRPFEEVPPSTPHLQKLVIRLDVVM